MVCYYSRIHKEDGQQKENFKGNQAKKDEFMM